MEIIYDPPKREWTLRERGLDFADAKEVFETGIVREFIDDRRDYGEMRVISFGYLRGRLVAIVWTQRGNKRHVFSMRKANDREKAKAR